MPRIVSSKFLETILARSTDEVIVLLLTVSHQDFAEAIRVCLGTLSIESRGNLYTFFPFEFTLPDEREDQPPQARLVVDGVDRAIVAALRQISSPCSVTMEIVLESVPDTVEIPFAPMQWKGIAYDVQRVEGILEGPRDFYSRFPKDVFSPNTTPGMFFGGPNL